MTLGAPRPKEAAIEWEGGLGGGKASSAPLPRSSCNEAPTKLQKLGEACTARPCMPCAHPQVRPRRRLTPHAPAPRQPEAVLPARARRPQVTCARHLPPNCASAHLSCFSAHEVQI